MFVKAIRTHIQPGSMVYREEGVEFDHQGKAYEHVEAVRRAKPDEAKPDEE